MSDDDDLTIEADETVPAYTLFDIQGNAKKTQRHLKALNNLNIINQAYIEKTRHLADRLDNDPIIQGLSKVTSIAAETLDWVMNGLQRLLIIVIVILLLLAVVYVAINKCLDRCIRTVM